MTHMVGMCHPVKQVGAPNLPDVLKAFVVDVGRGDIVPHEQQPLLIEPAAREDGHPAAAAAMATAGMSFNSVGPSM